MTAVYQYIYEEIVSLGLIFRKEIIILFLRELNPYRILDNVQIYPI